MKHFIVEITYSGSADILDAARLKHRDHLGDGYRAGLLLYSGPTVPRGGGIVVARADSREDVESFFAKDPLHAARVADFRIIEFEPVLHHPGMKAWIDGASL